jgi:hypothetical protein
MVNIMRNNYHKLLRTIIIISLFLFSKNGMTQVELTGFFDVVHTHNFSDNLNNGFQINQFEIDISAGYKGHFSLGTAIVYIPDENQLNLAMAYLHYNILTGEPMHPRREEETNHFGIIAGKFDIHFGLDYLSFASPDRPVVSQPLIIEKTIAGWNDIGLGIHLMRKYFAIDLWSVNGFFGGFNIGGNFRIKPFSFMQAGFSHATDFNEKSEAMNRLEGVDIRLNFHPVEIISEYLWTSALYEGDIDTLSINNIREGFYIQAVTKFDNIINLPFFMTLRYGYCNPRLDDEVINADCEAITRYTFGLGYNFAKYCSARLEVQSNQYETKKTNNMLYLQIVVAY